ncbi:hypothetical protein QTN25_008578 [Entamoeba marina]
MSQNSSTDATFSTIDLPAMLNLKTDQDYQLGSTESTSSQRKGVPSAQTAFLDESKLNQYGKYQPIEGDIRLRDRRGKERFAKPTKSRSIHPSQNSQGSSSQPTDDSDVQLKLPKTRVNENFFAKDVQITDSSSGIDKPSESISEIPHAALNDSFFK